MSPKLMPAPGHSVIEEPPGDLAVAPATAADQGTLYRRHVADVSRWARRFGVPAPDVEDVVHDVFVVAFRRRSDFDPGRAAFGTWLFGVTAKVVQARRRRERWRARLRRAFPWWGDEAGVRSPRVADAAEASTSVDRDEATELLHALLGEIGEKYRTAIVMFELEGLTCEEIAAAVGCSLANVYVRVHRGRKKLAAALARHREQTVDRTRATEAPDE